MVTPSPFILQPIPLYSPSPGRGRGKKKKEGLPPLLDAPIDFFHTTKLNIVVKYMKRLGFILLE